MAEPKEAPSSPPEIPVAADEAPEMDAVEDESPPSPEEMAAYLGESDPFSDTDRETLSSDQPLPDLAEAEQRIPEKTKALMDELFRAKLQKVQLIDPKTIR